MAEGVLGEVVARKRIDVAERLAGRSLENLRAEAAPSTRSLRAGLARPGARFIMEVKRVSPSQGSLRSDVDPAENADRLAALLQGYGHPTEADTVALNAGALLMIAGLVPALREGVAMALDAMGRGEPYRRLKLFAEATHG